MSNRTFRFLFIAQVVALLGTGMLTIALGLMAYSLAGSEAGQVLGIALTIKMIAYVAFSPLAGALFANLPRKAVLIGSDIVRFICAIVLPFISEVWQIYILIFILQLASASFTPVFQSVIPDILKSERDYTKALSLSRLTYDIENLASPLLAGFLLFYIPYSGLFTVTGVGFLISAILVFFAFIPETQGNKQGPFSERLVRGTKIYLATPRLRGLLLLNICATAIGAMVIVNSIVIVREIYGGTEGDLAIAMAAFGTGSMISALVLPSVLNQLKDRQVMLISGGLTVLLLGSLGFYISLFNWPMWNLFLIVWLVAGLGYSGILTPSGRLLRRSSHAEDRPTLFTAQFALSHACWLFAYPLAGTLAAHGGFGLTFIAFFFISAASLYFAVTCWPKNSSNELTHSHENLPPDHPHLQEHKLLGSGNLHKHVFVIDDEHRVWPTNG